MVDVRLKSRILFQFGTAPTGIKILFAVSVHREFVSSLNLERIRSFCFSG